MLAGVNVETPQVARPKHIFKIGKWIEKVEEQESHEVSANIVGKESEVKNDASSEEAPSSQVVCIVVVMIRVESVVVVAACDKSCFPVALCFFCL